MKLSHMALFGAGLAAAGAVYVTAGPLNPPAGPVASSYKTLGEVEPRIAVNATNTPGNATNLFIISQPGSYYLTGNITGVAGKNGIQISANNVTLDLCGFTMQGIAASQRGIVLGVSGLTNTRIRNGTVRDWGALEQIAPPSYSVLEDITTVGGTVGITTGQVTAIRCTFLNASTTGIIAGGGLFRDCVAANCVRGFDMHQGTIVSCRADSCSNTGFYVYSGATADHCIAYACGRGFDVVSAGTVDSCAAQNCTGTGFNLNEGSTAVNCAANSCDVGVVALRGSVVRGCSARDSAGEGFLTAADGNVLESCSATTSGLTRVAAAFNAASNDVLTNCSATGSPSDGFRCVDSCRLTNCTATGSAGDGFHVQFGCTIKGCTARFNTGDGIETAAGGMIQDNLCDSNGQGASVGANILATGYGARIEGNSLVGADYGVRATSGSNVIIRNSSSNCPNHYGGIAAGNDVGPIGSAASAASPWANIQY